MFAMFHRNGKPDLAPGTAADFPAAGLIRPESATVLLSNPRRQKLVEQIWQRTSLSRNQFALIYMRAIERYAELVQQFPASEAHHHSYSGGMLDHALEAMVCALKLRQSHLLPVGAPAETQAEQAEAWTAAIACASLVHDVGKIAVDLHVEYDDGQCWHPWHGPLARPYRFRYRKDRVYRLHNAAAGLLYRDVLEKAILDWLSGFDELWSAFLYLLAGQYEHAGVLGELVIQADQASAILQLGGDPAKARTAPKHALQRKLLDGLRFLAREALKLNQAQASDGWLTDDGLWLVAKTVCDKLRAHLLSQGFEGIPDSNIAVFNVLQDHGLVQATPDKKAVWRATVTSAAGWTHTFTLLRLSPSLIWDAGERPASYAGTVRVDTGSEESAVVEAASLQRRSDLKPPALDQPAETSEGLVDVENEIQGSSSPPIVASRPASTVPVASPIDDVATNESQRSTWAANQTDDSPGMMFVTWLRDAITTRRLRINEAKALVHTVDSTAFLVTPGVFQRYAQEHPEVARYAKPEKLDGWQWAQKKFERLRLHKKQQSGLNIWTCEVTGPRKSRHLHGYLLSDPGVLFSETPPDNPYLKLK